MADDGDLTLTDKTVMVVEDDAIVGLGLVAYLESLGADVSWLGSVDDALAWMETAPVVDMAVVDLNLDGASSTPVVDRLVAGRIYTILCTGYDETSIEERFRALPRSEKPFTRARLRQLLVGARC